ncbi:type II secretion system F family protein [Psychroserpens sp. SPM9]|uniref:type II secretion system F family protein n=1 Tax=Psychroserpens sp. SPM9 TaxID=2975598 RepID=UPI0021A507A9|nr:type II secretion system F family protein [Psychroserpens sp. SPM9]MDG5490649.1 type II secretion system F family protein [Psychroserpens sp. SPM9]
MAFQLDNIHEHKTIATKGNNSIESILNKEIVVLKKPFSNKIKEAFYSELSVLLNAGINLKQSLELIINSQKNKKTKIILEAILKAIVNGQSFSEAIKPYKDFSDYEYHSIKIGEETGTMSKIAQQLGDFYAKKNEQRRQLISALTYPTIILTTAILVVIFMLQFVVPMFQDIFKQQNVELPAITQFVVNLSNTIQNYGWLILLLIFSFILTNMVVRKKYWYKRIKDRTLIRIPFIGKFLKTMYLSQFTQSMMLLTASKLPIVSSVGLVKKMIDFYPLTTALDDVEKHIVQGHSFSNSLSNHDLFDDRMITLVKVSEETNQTEYIFTKLNTIYAAKVQNSSKMLSTLLEPFIIIFIGVFVGFILIAMYLPMFRLSSII